MSLGVYWDGEEVGRLERVDEHSPSPGLDRLAGAQAAVFHFLVGNADAHAKNISRTPRVV